jgi:hypothetical protein
VQENRGDRKNHVPPAALIAVQVIHLLSGAANVVLFLLTRPNLLLFSRDGDGDDPIGHNHPHYRAEVDSIEGEKRGYDDRDEY